MINNCKAACKKCTVPFKPRAKLSPSAKPASLTISSPVTVGSLTSNLQQTAGNASEGVGSVLTKGSEAVAGAVVAGQKVLSQGKEAAGAAAEKAADVVSTGSEAASKASDTLKGAAKSIAKTGSALVSGAKENAATAKDAVTTSIQSNPVLNKAGAAAVTGSNELLQAVKQAVNASKAVTQEDLLKTGVGKKYNAAQVCRAKLSFLPVAHTCRAVKRCAMPCCAMLCLSQDIVWLSRQGRCTAGGCCGCWLGGFAMCAPAISSSSNSSPLPVKPSTNNVQRQSYTQFICFCSFRRQLSNEMQKTLQMC